MALSKALVLCCSKAGLAVARALGARGVPVVGVWYGRTRIVTSSKHVKESREAPDPAVDEAGFVDFLLAHADEWHGSVLFPTDDASLLAVSRHKARLGGAYRVVAEDWAVVRRLLEKLSTYQLAERLGVPAPAVRKVTTPEAAEAFAQQVGFPCLLKPSVGHEFFRRYHAKMIKAASMRELREAMATLSGYPGELMLSEYIPGDDTCGANYNSFRHGGEVVAEFTARKVRLKPSRIGFPTVVRSTRLEEVLEAGRRLLSGMDFSGFSCMEFKKDARDGVYKLMEVNARHNFSGMLALACGVNFPWLSYAQAIGAEVNPQPSTWREDAYWIDEERDLKGLLKSLRRPAAARAYAEPYRRRPVYAVWSAADPGPSLRLAAETLRHAAGRALRLERGPKTGQGEKQLQA